MKISTSLILSAAVFSLLSCAENKKANTAETATAESLEAPVSSAATLPQATSATITNMDDKNLQATMEVTEPTSETPMPTTAPGMNPPHGMPGHDCAVAVGAPLNGKNATAAPQNAPQNTAPQNSAPANGPLLSVPRISSTPAGINPPHGEPGHDCSIAVGAPLRK